MLSNVALLLLGATPKESAYLYDEQSTLYTRQSTRIIQRRASVHVYNLSKVNGFGD